MRLTLTAQPPQLMPCEKPSQTLKIPPFSQNREKNSRSKDEEGELLGHGGQSHQNPTQWSPPNLRLRVSPRFPPSSTRRRLLRGGRRRRLHQRHPHHRHRTGKRKPERVCTAEYLMDMPIGRFRWLEVNPGR